VRSGRSATATSGGQGPRPVPHPACVRGEEHAQADGGRRYRLRRRARCPPPHDVVQLADAEPVHKRVGLLPVSSANHASTRSGHFASAVWLYFHEAGGCTDTRTTSRRLPPVANPRGHTRATCARRARDTRVAGVQPRIPVRGLRMAAAKRVGDGHAEASSDPGHRRRRWRHWPEGGRAAARPAGACPRPRAPRRRPGRGPCARIASMATRATSFAARMGMLPKPTYTGGVPASRNATNSAGSAGWGTRCPV
jgi:hypothetical protein